ncbi:hypothetical protein V6x_51500 [Gimesia chilikensis]|uniref:Uncharacterized protein n=1 Tax=Gimesia chilikensis TaxID=2605989 RepID=A0A517WJK4_9PLAN|nr:hypothetical protein V6x_51500 [Gimesia chilikensis]
MESGIFEKFGPEEWQLVVMVGLSVVSGIGTIVLCVAAWTLKYIIDVEKNTSSSAASTMAMAESLKSLKDDNDKDHEVIHERIDGVLVTQNERSKKLVEHGLNIQNLQRRGCES